MTLDEVKNFFGSSYEFSKKTGMAHTNYLNWKRKGYIPYVTQQRLHEISHGKLLVKYNGIEGARYSKKD